MNEVFLLDVGSGKLAFAVGNKSDAGVYNVRHIASCEYDGYYKGEFLAPDALEESVRQTIAESGYRGRINKLYVGVPTDFIKVRNNQVKNTYRSARTVTDDTLDELYARGNIFDGDADYVAINCSARGFTLDNKFRCVNPIYEQATYIDADLTYIMCDKKFCETIERLAAAIGVRRVSYISSFWATCVQMLPSDVREQGAAVCDIGFSNTSFGIVVGDGLECAASKSIGGANIAGDLYQVLDIPFASASTLVSKANLYLETDNGSCYNVLVDGKPEQFNSFGVNRIIQARLDDFVEFISEQLAQNGNFSTEVVYLTGGGIASLKGAAAYISRQLGMRLETIVPDVPTYGKSYYSSVFGTFDVADKLEKSKNVLKRFFERFRR